MTNTLEMNGKTKLSQRSRRCIEKSNRNCRTENTINKNLTGWAQKQIEYKFASQLEWAWMINRNYPVWTTQRDLRKYKPSLGPLGQYKRPNICVIGVLEGEKEYGA